jgi:sulfatase modifying factor 1
MTNCGPGGGGTESCCASLEVPGGVFYRNSDPTTNSPQAGLATVSGLRIDKYEITVGRFRQFVLAASRGWLPAQGSGKHVHLNGGRGLVNSAQSTVVSYESGWDSSWSAELATSAADWDAGLSSSYLPTWTQSPGTNENRPINSVDWYDVYAFCIWDGGFLPSDAEWNYVASGGGEQREFPWSVPPTSSEIDCSYANYGGGNDGPAGYCRPSGTDNVGSESPKGDGKWGQSDLGGNVWEWVLDEASGQSCVDCATVPLPSLGSLDNAPRMTRGGGLGAAFSLETAITDEDEASDRSIEQGARCARVP